MALNNLAVPEGPESRIHEALIYYDSSLATHPIARLCRDGILPRPLALEFARAQYVDSTLWVAMLSLAKGKVKNHKLSEAIRKNILCEVGNEGVPHTTLCQSFVESLGESARFGTYENYAPVAAHPMEVMNVFDQAGDGLIAGWLLVSETLVPRLFQVFRPAFTQFHGADLRYLDEHITVDADEHSKWMLEAALEIAETPEGLEEVLQGMALGGRVTLSVPDALYAQALLTRH